MIESVTYRKGYFNENIQMVLVKDGVTMYVPLDEDNRHYIEIQEWVAEGNKIEEPE